RGLTSIRNFVRDPKRGRLAPGLSATSFLLDAYHAPEDGTAVDRALATRPAPGASPPRFAAPGNFASGPNKRSASTGGLTEPRLREPERSRASGPRARATGAADRDRGR